MYLSDQVTVVISGRQPNFWFPSGFANQLPVYQHPLVPYFNAATNPESSLLAPILNIIIVNGNLHTEEEAQPVKTDYPAETLETRLDTEPESAESEEIVAEILDQERVLGLSCCNQDEPEYNIDTELVFEICSLSTFSTALGRPV